jgi:hypothetical protein
VGVHGGPDVSPYVVGGGAMVEAGTASGRYTGCSGRLKQGFGRRNNIGEGHLLVVDDQT